MRFRFVISKVPSSELDLDNDPPDYSGDTKYRDALRDVEKNGQRRRIPISVYGVVVGEYHLFYALIEADIQTIEIIRLANPALEPEIEAAKKVSAKFPIGDQTSSRAVRDALKMIKLGVQPPEDVALHLKPLVELFSD